MSGIDLIAAERQRQIDQEDFSHEHDDCHDEGELARAAACYAFPIIPGPHDLPIGWPTDWDADWWKPSDDPIRNLAKAGALIAAEIDRLLRMSDRRNGI